MIRFPRLCRSDLSTRTLLHPISIPMSLMLNGISNATLVLNPDETADIHDWVEIYTSAGSAGFFRVVSVATTPLQKVQLSLNHGIDVLNDAIVTTDEEITGSVASVLQELLSYQVTRINGQPCWVLGECTDLNTYTVPTSYSSVWDCIRALLDHEPDYMLVYNMSTFPWELHFVRRPIYPECECRLTRNIENCTITLDEADLCTRISMAIEVHSFDEDGNETQETQHRIFDDMDAQSIYGIVTKAVSIDSAVDDPQTYAEKYFRLYNHPTVQIEISALDLAEHTGVGLDQLVLGTICRVALVDLGGTWNEQIVAAQYPDLMGQTERVKLSLSTTKRLVSDTYKSVSRAVERAENTAVETAKVSKNRATQIKNELKKQYKEANDQYSKINNVEIALDEVNAQIRLKADSTVTTALEQRVSEAEITIDGQNARINLKADSTYVRKLADDVEGVTRRVTNAEVTVDGMNARIDLKADSSTVTQLRNDVAGVETRVSSAEIAVDGLNGQISLKADTTVVTKLQDDLNTVTTRVGQAEIDIDSANARIDLKANSSEVTRLQGDVNSVTTRVGNAEIAIDAANGRIDLKADTSVVTEVQGDLESMETRVSNAEINIDSANGRIDLKADTTTVNAMGERVSAAEISIDSLNGEIDLKADKIDLNGYVTANQLETELASIQTQFSNSIVSSSGSFGTVNTNTIIIGDAQEEREYTFRHRPIVMGTILPSGTQVLATSSSTIDLTHYHTLSCDSNGVVSMGAITTDASAATFDMADTAFYKNAVSAAYNRGYQEGGAGAAGSMVAGPNLYNVEQDTTAKKVEFEIGYKLNGQDNFTYVSREVPAGDVYDAGYQAGLAAAVGSMVSGPTLYNIEQDTANNKVTFDIGYRLNGQQSMTYVSKEIAAGDIYTSGYNTGHTAGLADAVGSMVSGPTLYNIEQDTANNKVTFDIGYRLNGQQSMTYVSKEIAAGDIYTNGYNTGYGDGYDDVGFAQNVTLTNITQNVTNNTVDFDISWRLDNESATTTSHRSIPAGDIYNSGYSAGNTAGQSAVTVSTITAGTPTYNSSTHDSTLDITATASNGATKTQSITVSGSSAFTTGHSAGYSSGYTAGRNAGRTEGANSVTIRNVAYEVMQRTGDDAWYVEFQLTLSNGYLQTYVINADDLLIPEDDDPGGGSGTVDIIVSVDTHALSVERTGSPPYYTYTVKSQAIAKFEASDGRTGTAVDWQYYDASGIYSAGYNAGLAAGQSGATIHDVTISNVVYHDEYYYKNINFDVTVEMSDGSTASYTRNVQGKQAYDAGYSAGQSDGRSSAQVDTSTVQISGTPTYYRNSQMYYFDVYAETNYNSSGQTATGIGLNAHAAWLHGYQDGSGYIRAEVTRMTCEFDSSTGDYEYMVYLKLYDLGGVCSDRSTSISWTTKTRL